MDCQALPRQTQDRIRTNCVEARGSDQYVFESEAHQILDHDRRQAGGFRSHLDNGGANCG